MDRLENKSEIIGKKISGIIDRPMGSHHPKYTDIVYTVNYGYVEGVYANDGEEQDVYVLGTDGPIDKFEGNIIAIYHRLNDIEDKWIVSIDGQNYTDEYILEAISFQEKYFKGYLIR